MSQLFLSPLGFLIVSPSPWTLWFCFFVCLVCFLMLYFINHVLHCKYTFICFSNSIGGAFHTVLLKKMIDRFPFQHFLLIGCLAECFLHFAVFPPTLLIVLSCFAGFSLSFHFPFQVPGKSHLLVLLFLFFKPSIDLSRKLLKPASGIM